MIEKNKKIPVIPLFAGILILIHVVLIESVTPPAFDSGSMRYLLYWLMVSLSSIGTNLLALYVGYTMSSLSTPWRKLSKIAFYLVVLGLLSVLWGGITFKAFASSDLWILLLPISSNRFPFAASMLVLCLVGPFLIKVINHMSLKQRRSLSFGIIWLGLILPFIFNQPLWGTKTASSLVIVVILFLIGQLLAKGEFKYFFSIQTVIPVMIVNLVLIVIVTKSTPVTQSAANLTGRFLATYQLNMVVFSIVMFTTMIKLFRGFFQKGTNYNWFAVSSYFIASLPIIEYRLGHAFRLGVHPSSINWLGWIGIESFVLIVVVGCLSIIVSLLSSHTIFKNWIDYLTLNDIFELPLFFKRMFIDNWRLLLVMLISFILTFGQYLFVNLATATLSWQLIQGFFGVLGPRFLFNIVIFVLAFLLLFGLMNRFWPALLLTSGFSMLITIAEYLKISLREEPILPTDLSAITAIHDIAGMISPIILIAAVIVLVILVVSSILLQRHLGGRYPRKYLALRLITILLTGGFFVSMYWASYSNTFANIVCKAFGINIQYYDQTGSAQHNGPIVQFMINLDTKIMDKPAGYSKARIQAIMKKYDGVATEINKTRKSTLKNQTVLFVLSESFSDPNRVPNLKVSPNPMPYLTSLKKKTNSGIMLSQGYGGGTADMEWESFTGLALSNLSPTLTTPYTQLVPQQKVSPAFTDLFDNKFAVHPYNASLYNRKQVYKKIGFQKFYYQGSSYRLSDQKRLGTSPYVSDKAAYKDTLKLLKQNQKGSKFVQLSTMQNHLPFSNYYKNGQKYTLSGSAYDKNNKDSVETYAQGINYTDKALKKFIHQIDQIKKPVTVVWYGDHLASLYTAQLMDKYPIQLHETDYFVYNNQSHKLSYTNRLVSPYSFSALALASNSTKVTPYYALITKVTDDLPAMTIDPLGLE